MVSEIQPGDGTRHLNSALRWHSGAWSPP